VLDYEADGAGYRDPSKRWSGSGDGRTSPTRPPSRCSGTLKRMGASRRLRRTAVALADKSRFGNVELRA